MENRFETFAGSVTELNRCLQKIKELEMKKFGLKAGHAMCLYYLGKNPEGMTAAQLTKSCHEDKAAISRAINQLIDRGLVSGQQFNNKRSYRNRLCLTQDGIELAEKINRRIDAALSGGGDGLTEEQRCSFYSSMELILNNLKSYIFDSETE